MNNKKFILVVIIGILALLAFVWPRLPRAEAARPVYLVQYPNCPTPNWPTFWRSGVLWCKPSSTIIRQATDGGNRIPTLSSQLGMHRITSIHRRGRLLPTRSVHKRQRAQDVMGFRRFSFTAKRIRIRGPQRQYWNARETNLTCGYTSIVGYKPERC